MNEEEQEINTEEEETQDQYSEEQDTKKKEESQPEEDDEEDFDFSIYGDDEEVEQVQDLHKKIAPVTGLRSRFSNGENEMIRLSNIINSLSEAAVDVSSRTQDISKLWRYYALLDEYWAVMKDVFGQHLQDQINAVKKTCRECLEEAGGDQEIKPKVHNNLLYLRDKLYYLRQVGNFGFEVDRVGGGFHGKAKRAIIE